MTLRIAFHRDNTVAAIILLLTLVGTTATFRLAF